MQPTAVPSTPPPAPRPVEDPHAARVAAIAAQIADKVRRGEKVHIQKGGVHHFVPLPGDQRFTGGAVDISGLRHVLSVDRERRVCVAEPGVTFAEVVRATLPHGLLPTVVPELEGITLGGAVAGCSVEAMSFHEGGFHDSCLEYEVVTSAGEIIRLSPTKEPDLFHRIHGSYGTLGVLTQLTFRLVPAKPYVRLEYQRFADAAAFHEAMLKRVFARDVDFIDAIVHDPSVPRPFVLCLGRFADAAPYVSDYRGERIFYKSTLTRAEDYLTTFDYCFRYDTECHWLTKTVPPLEWAPVRKTLGRFFLGSTNLIRWSGRLEKVLALKKRPDVVVDIFIPSAKWGEFYAWYEREFKFWPLWVVPYRVAEMYPWMSPAQQARAKAAMGTGQDSDLFLDCAIYGKRNDDPSVDWSQVLEEKTYELGGIKTLISRNHYTPERFWDVYDRPGYEAAKRRLDPAGIFPGVYEKFHRA